MAQSRLFLLLIILFLGPATLRSQQADSSLFVRIDLAPRWIWRGVSYSTTPVVQPSAGWSGKRLTTYIFGSYATGPGEYHEVDFIAEYQAFRWIKIGFTDYFGIVDSLKSRQQFFDLNRKTTMHMFDIYGVFTPFKRLPLSLMASWWFWGADRELVTLDQNFSTYLEVRYDQPFGRYILSGFAGGTPAKGFYAGSAAFINTGLGLSRTWSLAHEVTMPAKVEFILNPYLQSVYVNAILSLVL